MQYVLAKASDAVASKEVEGKIVEAGKDATYHLIQLEQKEDVNGNSVMVRSSVRQVTFKDIDNRILMLNADILRIQAEIAKWEELKKSVKE
jgi:uncharacterized small protein (DUF1192 family)